ncbi:MAG: hypothetical protein ACETWK_08970 [Candidatus Aminicenantaceae bacterium]
MTDSSVNYNFNSKNSHRQLLCTYCKRLFFRDKERKAWVYGEEGRMKAERGSGVRLYYEKMPKA